MKIVTKLALVLIPTITFSVTAVAHDPSMHIKKGEKADCSQMDHSKMDMNDPVVIAMMKKCLKQSEANKNQMNSMDHSQMGKTVPKSNKNDEHNEHNH